MRNKKIIRLFTAMLAVVLCTTAFAVPASAGGGDGEPYYTETAGTEAAPTGDAESPEVTVTDDEDTAGNNDTQAGADTLDQLAELLGGLGNSIVFLCPFHNSFNFSLLLPIQICRHFDVSCLWLLFEKQFVQPPFPVCTDASKRHNSCPSDKGEPWDERIWSE